MTSCPRCGSEKVVVDTTKDGHPYLRDYGQPHRLTCTVNKSKTHGTGKARPKVSPVRKELESLGLSAEEADKIIKAHPRASDDELVMAALKEKGQE
ncbi:hypothetical protein LCGC14_1333170 [marine sediment metagenome]|uniref:Uncharacterized protein n=1 Tax=marine sediment metagenome TaxID=412755 RepID=A0A0F9NIE5_9ZZZZ